jgi:hypothetical protein
MSRWASDGSDTLIQAEAPGGRESGTPGAPAPQGDELIHGGPERLDGPTPIGAPPALPRVPFWVRVVPFFLSAFFFMSGLFSLFSPLPLLLTRFRSGRRWALAAMAVNSAVVGIATGPEWLAGYLVFIVIPSLVLSELLGLRQSIERSVGGALLAIVAAGFLVIGGYSWAHHLNAFHQLHDLVALSVDQIHSSAVAGGLLATGDADEWKQGLLVELPSALAVLCLVLVWSNLVVLLRINPGGLRESIGLADGSLRRWKAPEWLIWPTIGCGFFLLKDMGVASDVALNFFKFLMAVYALQGLSVLAFFFEQWKIRGFFRAAGYLLSVFLMMPLLLSLGFFDLWFDFRSKFRQT